MQPGGLAGVLVHLGEAAQVGSGWQGGAACGRSSSLAARILSALTKLEMTNIVTATERTAAVQPTVTPFHHSATGTWSYVVADPATARGRHHRPGARLRLEAPAAPARRAPIASSRTAASSGLQVRWILETHAHADHLSSAQYLKGELGGEVAIGSGIRSVQRTFKTLFGLGPEFEPDGSQFDRLLDDDDDAAARRGFDPRLPRQATPTTASASWSATRSSSATRCSCPTAVRRAATFPGGDAAQLFRSVQRLYSLPAGTRVFVCHDYSPGGRAARVRDHASRSSAAPTSTSATASTSRHSSGCARSAMPRSTCRT